MGNHTFKDFSKLSEVLALRNKPVMIEAGLYASRPVSGLNLYMTREVASELTKRHEVEFEMDIIQFKPDNSIEIRIKIHELSSQKQHRSKLIEYAKENTHCTHRVIFGNDRPYIDQVDGFGTTAVKAELTEESLLVIIPAKRNEQRTPAKRQPKAAPKHRFNQLLIELNELAASGHLSDVRMSIEYEGDTIEFGMPFKLTGRIVKEEKLG